MTIAQTDEQLLGNRSECGPASSLSWCSGSRGSSSLSFCPTTFSTQCWLRPYARWLSSVVVDFQPRAWYERVGALILIVLAVIGTKRIVHVSIATGSMGYLLFVMAIPVMSLALVAAAVVSRRLSAGPGAR